MESPIPSCAIMAYLCDGKLVIKGGIVQTQLQVSVLQILTAA